MKRLLGTLSLLLLLNFMVMGSRLVCAGRVMPSSTPGMQSHAEHEQDTHHHGAGKTKHNTGEPVTTSPCQGMTSCAPALGAVPDVDLVDTQLEIPTDPHGPTSAALTRLVAPDTPPPRA